MEIDFKDFAIVNIDTVGELSSAICFRTVEDFIEYEEYEKGGIDVALGEQYVHNKNVSTSPPPTTEYINSSYK